MDHNFYRRKVDTSSYRDVSVDLFQALLPDVVLQVVHLPGDGVDPSVLWKDYFKVVAFVIISTL